MVGLAAEAPSQADAERAARPLIDAGVGQVLLFGSVARGEASADSDIDLVAIFADLDYSERAARRRELEAAAEAHVGWPVQVFVTDWPEWCARVELVASSFEHRIADTAVPLAGAEFEEPPTGRKEMVLPMSDHQEALREFQDWVLRALDDLAGAVSRGVMEQGRGVMEQGSGAAADGIELARLNRMARVCRGAAMTVETTLKGLATLYTAPPPTLEDLKRNGHNIEKLCDRLSGAAPAQVVSSLRAIFDHHGIDLGDLSSWRVDSTYPDDAPTVGARAGGLAETYAVMAPTVAEVLADHLRKQLDADDPALAAATGRLTCLAAAIANYDVRSGLPKGAEGEGRP